MDLTKKKILLCMLALILAVLMAATPDKAMALSSAHSTALMDWTSFTISQGDSDTLFLPSLGINPEDISLDQTGLNNWNTYSGASAAPPWPARPGVANTLGEQDSALNDVGRHSLDIAVTGANAKGWTPSATLNGYIGGETIANPGLAGMGARAEATSWFNNANEDTYGFFLLDGTGTLTIEIDYYLGLDLSTDIAGDTASGLASVDLGLAFVDLPYFMQTGQIRFSAISTDADLMANTVFNGADYATSASGTLSVSLAKSVDGPVAVLVFDTLAYSEAQAFSAVPEPATLLLLGSGLIGAAGLGRRQRRR